MYPQACPVVPENSGYRCLDSLKCPDPSPLHRPPSQAGPLPGDQCGHGSDGAAHPGATVSCGPRRSWGWVTALSGMWVSVFSTVPPREQGPCMCSMSPYLRVQKAPGTQRHSGIFVKERGVGRREGGRGVVTAREVVPTRGDRSRRSGGRSQSRHSPPRPCAGDHLHSRPGDSLRGHGR